MKKIGVVIFLFILAISPLVIATSHVGNDSDEDTPPVTTDNVDQAYQCLSDIIDEKDQDDLSLQEAIFSTLALGSDSKLTDRIEDDKHANDCWPDSGCNVKETAQVLLAYDRINKNTDEIEEWLVTQNDSTTQLTWYLEIDITNHIPAECTLTYEDDTQRTINIDEDMTISGNPGTCFTIAASGFWLKLKESCYGETFRVSCDGDFITTLLYQKTGSSTIFVSPNTHSAASSGTTEEMVNSQCFRTSGSCDYEGSLWGTLALDKQGYDVSAFLPFLSALAEDNKRLFPSSFLYVLTVGNDYYSQVVQSQQQNQFWKAPNTQYNKFYDTALGLISLQGTGAPEFSNAQNYLLGIQTPDGCWNNNNIRDTAFLLYAGWPKAVSGVSGGGGTLESCSAVGYCGSPIACDASQGNVLNNYFCPGFEICCNIPLVAPSCTAQQGILCTANQQCSGTTLQSSDAGTCCVGTCEAISQVNNCQLIGGTCSFSCDSDIEDQTTESCEDAGLVCCILKAEEEGRNLLPLILTLAILIVLIIMAILFRKKLQVLWFKFRQKKGRRPRPPGALGIGQRRPGYPPRPGVQPGRPVPPGVRPRPMPPRPSHPTQVRRPKSQSDKELEETLKKLKEISK